MAGCESHLNHLSAAVVKDLGPSEIGHVMYTV